MFVRFMVFLLPAKSARLLLILSIGCFHCDINDSSEDSWERRPSLPARFGQLAIAGNQAGRGGRRSQEVHCFRASQCDMNDSSENRL
jgi:hypothetical protein